MTMKLPQKAGFAPTVQEWDQLVRIAENLAAQLAQAQAERDAARAEVARLRAALEREFVAGAKWWEYRQTNGTMWASDRALAEAEAQRRAALRQPAPAPAQYQLDDEPCENCVHGKKWHWDGGKCQNACPCEQYKPAPAGGEARE